MKCSCCQQQLDPDVNRTCIPNTMSILEANLTGIAVSINVSFLAVFSLRPGHFSTFKPAEFCRDLLGEEGGCGEVAQGNRMVGEEGEGGSSGSRNVGPCV